MPAVVTPKPVRSHGIVAAVPSDCDSEEGRTAPRCCLRFSSPLSPWQLRSFPRDQAVLGERLPKQRLCGSTLRGSFAARGKSDGTWIQILILRICQS